MYIKRAKFPLLGPGIGFEFGFDMNGWWIDHQDKHGPVRTYMLFGPNIQRYDDGTIVNFHLLCFKFTMAVLKKDNQ